jgi:ribonuclease BN (tRNA processing enzyme)
MKLTFLGVGNAFTTSDYWQSNMMIEEDGDILLIDFGSDIRHSIKEVKPEINSGNLAEHIKAVYISHIHADHIAGLEWLGFATYFNPKAPKVPLIANKDIEKELWNESLKGGMKSVEYEDEKHFQDYFSLTLLQDNHSFKFKGVKFTPVKVVHVPSNIPKHSYGLMIDGKKKAYITTDCVFDSDRKEYNEADIIFHDCETTPFKSQVHAHYEDLRTLPEDIKAKMWLYHYDPEGHKNFDPKKDGFAGYVKKGQSFDI